MENILKIEFEEYINMVKIAFAEFSVYGMLNANEYRECPCFWIRNILNPKDMMEIALVFGEKYYLSKVFYWN